MISGISPIMDFLKSVAGILFFGLPFGLPDCPGLYFGVGMLFLLCLFQ
jgi:hypothetical protein